MNNYKESDYAKNKYSHNIVYETSKGTIEITVTQYLNENPTKEEADFWELKALSDEVYRQQAKEEHTQTNRNARFDENIESVFFVFRRRRRFSLPARSANANKSLLRNYFVRCPIFNEDGSFST
ncbi:MAG: hypothetical protein LBL98_06740 [Ruminococcus sp.]|jgi:hypothetical protein|nr:hypothetical protein [Ruminococcus sp.]